MGHNQRAKAERLLALHEAPELLILPNVWNPIGARVLESQGYPAVATASAAVSASLGYADGERIRRSTLLDVVARVASSVSVPVTADIEAGYGASIAELRETVRAVIACGVVGINIEDSIVEGEPLRAVDEQCARIAAARETADHGGVPLVINARVDAFVSSASDPDAAMEETVARAAAYVDAGADCIYPMGPGDAETVTQLRRRIEAPINILITPQAAPLDALEQLGVNRVSFGPFVFRSLLKRYIDITAGLRDKRDYSALSDTLARDKAATYLRDEPE